MIYDITLPVENGLAAWPGDVPYHFELGWKIGQNDSTVNVGVIKLGVHTGTHADAPFHFSADGAGIGALDLAPFVGQAVVIDAIGRSTLDWELFQAIDFDLTPRILVKTGAWPDIAHFPASVPVLTDAAAEYFAERGVVLFGVDVPSVDALDSKTLPIHHALSQRNIAILEGLNLHAVPAGSYHLTALPLRLMGADGAPVRAILTPV